MKTIYQGYDLKITFMMVFIILSLGILMMISLIKNDKSEKDEMLNCELKCKTLSMKFYYIEYLSHNKNLCHCLNYFNGYYEDVIVGQIGDASYRKMLRW